MTVAGFQQEEKVWVDQDQLKMERKCCWAKGGRCCCNTVATIQLQTAIWRHQLLVVQSIWLAAKQGMSLGLHNKYYQAPIKRSNITTTTIPQYTSKGCTVEPANLNTGHILLQQWCPEEKMERCTFWLWSSTDCALLSSTKPNTIQLRQKREGKPCSNTVATIQLQITNIKPSTRKGFLSDMKTTAHRLYSRAG